MTQHTNHKQNPVENYTEFQVGDLVRVRGDHWVLKPMGVITEVRDLVHEHSGASYTVVTAALGDEFYTFSSKDFELISKAERKEID
jgi:hypothetical protein